MSSRLQPIILGLFVWLLAGYQVYTVYFRDDANRGWDISNKLFGWCRLLGEPTKEQFVSHAKRMSVVFFVFATISLILVLAFVDD